MVAHLLRQTQRAAAGESVAANRRWTRNVRTAEDRLDESDSRMRANAVEALWGDKTSRAASRASGAPWRTWISGCRQCVIRLYELQDQSVIPYILSMAGHEKPHFRATAAWTMGPDWRSAISSVLEKLTHDLYAPFEKALTRGMEQIGKTGRRSADGC